MILDDELTFNRSTSISLRRDNHNSSHRMKGVFSIQSIDIEISIV